MKISYAIPVCNEHEELKRLLDFLVRYIREEDEIVIQCDQGNTTPEVYELLDQGYTYLTKNPIKVIEFPLNGHFSNFKNNLKEMRNLLILELLYGTGIRLSELINLKIKDININKNEIKVLGKRNKERIIPINNNIRLQLNKYLKLRKEQDNRCEYLLITSKDKKSYPMLIYRIVKENLSNIINSEKYNPHLLRHTFATHLINKGANINAIKDLLGHSSLAATQVYTHNSIEKLKKTFQKSHPKA